MSNYNLPPDVIELIQDLKSRVERLERAPRAGNTSVDTGTFTVTDPNTGTTLLYIGQQEHGDMGVSLYREDGSLALQVAKPFSPADQQFLGLYNKGGDLIGGDQLLSSEGNAQYFATVPAKTSDTGVAVTSGSFVDIYDINTVFVSSAHVLYFTAICSDGTTAGEIRVVGEAGTILPRFFATSNATPIPAGTTAVTDLSTDSEGLYFVSRNLGSRMELKVQARRTTGAGTITIKPQYYSQEPL